MPDVGASQIYLKHEKLQLLLTLRDDRETASRCGSAQLFLRRR